MVNRATAAIEDSAELRGLVGQARVPVGSSVYNRILETLYDEAAILDERRVEEWLALLAKDIVYTAPMRITRTGPQRNKDIVRTVMHFNETYASLLIRVQRLTQTTSAWAEDPPSRTRRFVTNLRVAEAGFPGEYEAVSNLYYVRSRGETPDMESMTAERRDIWRVSDSGCLLARREIIPDQASLGVTALGVFL